MARTYGVIGATTRSEMQSAKDAGASVITLFSSWASAQPNGPDTALNTTYVASVNAQIANALSVGLEVMFEFAVHYMPDWILTNVEKYKDQNGFEYNDIVNPGKNQRNYAWSATGRGYYLDFITRMAAAMPNLSQIKSWRIGGGYYGELHYPFTDTAPYNYWGFGDCMQTGTDLAAGQTVCPLPGYIPFSGTDAQDCEWINWYLNGSVNWMNYQIQAHKSLGIAADLHILIAGFGIRSNQVRSNNGYRQAMAMGEDPVRYIAALAHDPQVWPWGTWINGSDPVPNSSIDSDQAAWKKIWAESYCRGKHYKLIGENTGNESNAGMDFIFSNPLSPTPYTGQPDFSGYAGLMWLNYANLTAGGSHATLAHYAQKISENP